MSTELKIIKKSGKTGSDLSIIKFFGGTDRGVMLQLTQGFGGSAAIAPTAVDEPGYIQLTFSDVYEVVVVLSQWLKDESDTRASVLQDAIDKQKALKKTIISDAVDCQHFIAALKILKIPVALLDRI